MESKFCAGVDEAGRGALAGPVVAAAVILGDAEKISDLADSKQLHPMHREKLAAEIRLKCLCWAIGIGSVEEIDAKNILQATLLAMKRALESLSIQPAMALVDGNQAPAVSVPVKTVVKGDSLVPEISAASILAKVTRDKIMCDLNEQYPNYEFAAHKGYSTIRHRAALLNYGITPIHRKTFAPVRIAMNKLNFLSNP